MNAKEATCKIMELVGSTFALSATYGEIKQCESEVEKIVEEAIGAAKSAIPDFPGTARSSYVP